MPIRVVQTVSGVFHHFDLAQELARRGMLQRVYSSFPWSRLQREDLDRSVVRTFPWIHPLQLAASRFFPLPTPLDRQLQRLARTSLDRYAALTLPDCDAYIAISSAGLVSGHRAQLRGAKYICDRGSSHIRYQHSILTEEYRRWGFATDRIHDSFFTTREEAEYAQADAITVPSTFARRTFLEMGVPAAKLHRIPYGVRLERFRRIAEPPRDGFEVLFVGSVDLRKGVPYLIEAFRALRHPRKRLRILGAVSTELRTFLGRQHLASIEILGPRPQAELAACMSASHVLVLPSIEDGFGLVMAEAMACGCPVIASEHTGGEDLFTDGVEGFIVPIRSAPAIAERLQQLADDSSLQQRMSEAALARVCSRGGWTQYGDAYTSFLESLVRTPNLTASAH